MEVILLQKIKIFLANLAQFIEAASTYLAGRTSLVITFMFAYIVLLTLLVLVYRRVARKGRENTEIVAKILAVLNPEQGLEKNLSDFLGMIIALIKADSYCFYVLDDKNSSYTLKSVRFSDQDNSSSPSPSYSGLSPYPKERYNPPLKLALDQPTGLKPVKIGEVPILVLSVKGGSGLIAVGPVKKLKRRQKRFLQYLIDHLAPALEILITAEQMRNQVNTITASNEAIRSITKSTTDLDGSLTVLLALSIKIIDAAGGCVMFIEDGQPIIMEISGLEQADEDLLYRDCLARENMFKLLGSRDMLIIQKQTPEYADIPDLFAALGVEKLVLAGITGRNITGLACYWLMGDQPVEQHRLSALGMLVKRMGEAFDRQLKFRLMAYSYLEMLKMLVDTVDNMEPHSTSHSELVARYTGVIAEEMGFNREEIKDTMLAGYLHDIGTLGLSGDILFKDGKYSQVEQETMKLHAEVGASIIDSTIANKNVASYIRHHHERWDGNGYPAGMKGEEIPLGARIISVADMLNAKLAGRKNRSPVSFQQALESIKAASGSQLDPAVTEVLINWFNKKRNTAVPQKILGHCWEMRCCPPELCQTCPAFGLTETNCWEITGVKCEAHGNNCTTCPLYTEYIHRSEQIVAGKA